MTDFNSLKRINQLAGRDEYMGDFIREKFWPLLVCQIEQLERFRRPGDLPIPNPAEPRAWARTWEILEDRIQREMELPAPAADHGSYAQAAQPWGNAVRDKEEVKRLLRYNRITSDEWIYCGGQIDDADDQHWVYDQRGFPPAYWMERADRIALALGKLSSLTATERVGIPQALELRKQAARLAALEAANRIPSSNTENDHV
jgi:hypothetical protein